MRGTSCLIALLVVGCTSKAPAPAVTKPPRAAIERCARGAAAMVEALQEAAASDRLVALADRPGVADVACSDLYRQPTCAAAWRGAFSSRNLDATTPVATIAKACAAAYCPHLPAGPALCAHEDGRSTPSVDELRELDTAILSYEGLDAAGARTIAARAAVLDLTVTKAVDVARPGPPPAGQPESLVLMLDEGGTPVVDGKPMEPSLVAGQLAKLAATGGQLVIQAHPRTPYAKVVELIERAKQAGVQRIALSTQP